MAVVVSHFGTKDTAFLEPNSKNVPIILGKLHRKAALLWAEGQTFQDELQLYRTMRRPTASSLFLPCVLRGGLGDWPTRDTQPRNYPLKDYG